MNREFSENHGEKGKRAVEGKQPIHGQTWIQDYLQSTSLGDLGTSHNLTDLLERMLGVSLRSIQVLEKL